jgi:hypothetical protein
MSAVEELTNEDQYLRRMQEHHREMVRLKLLGTSNEEIADRLGLSTSHVSHVINTPMVKAELLRLSGERNDEFVRTKERLDSLMPEAVETMKKILGEEPETTDGKRLKFQVARDVLDRRGPMKRTETTTSNVLTIEDIREVRQRAATISIQHEEISDDDGNPDS